MAGESCHFLALAALLRNGLGAQALHCALMRQLHTAFHIRIPHRRKQKKNLSSQSTELNLEPLQQELDRQTPPLPHFDLGIPDSNPASTPPLAIFPELDKNIQRKERDWTLVTVSIDLLRVDNNDRAIKAVAVALGDGVAVGSTVLAKVGSVLLAP